MTDRPPLVVTVTYTLAKRRKGGPHLCVGMNVDDDLLGLGGRPLRWMYGENGDGPEVTLQGTPALAAKPERRWGIPGANLEGRWPAIELELDQAARQIQAARGFGWESVGGSPLLLEAYRLGEDMAEALRAGLLYRSILERRRRARRPVSRSTSRALWVEP